MARKAFAAVALTVTAGIVLSGCAGASGDSADNTIDGEVKGDIKVVTWRTDLVEDGTFDKYAAEFNKKYPDVNVNFEAITDYEGEVRTRMNTKDYGDVLLIPNSITARPAAPLLRAARARSTSSRTSTGSSPSRRFEGKGYGIAITGNAQGVVYNKKIWAEAGITDAADHRGRVLAALQAIKAKTDAIPLYTNYKDGWPLTQWVGNRGAVTERPGRAR